jgi:hypothetical protein
MVQSQSNSYNQQITTSDSTETSVEYDLPKYWTRLADTSDVFNVPYLSKFLVFDEVAGTFMICPILIWEHEQTL